MMTTLCLTGCVPIDGTAPGTRVPELLMSGRVRIGTTDRFFSAEISDRPAALGSRATADQPGRDVNAA
jgi:hypothetical protein